MQGKQIPSALQQQQLAFLFSDLCHVPQVAQKVLKNAKMACHRLGHYRMPFAWAVRYCTCTTFLIELCYTPIQTWIYH